MAEIVQLEQPVVVLECEECGSQIFYIQLGGENPYNIGGYICADCGSSWDLLPLREVMKFNADDYEPDDD